jgi:hypothetical protein
METEVSKAVKVLTEALNDDPGYRLAWVANIAMAFVDEYQRVRPSNRNGVRKVANEAAEAFLRNLCYTTKQTQMNKLINGR